MQRSSRTPRRSGFTLFELLLVLAILSVVIGVSWFALGGWIDERSMIEGVEKFRTNLVKARALAMQEGRSYRGTWQQGGQFYRIAPDEIERWPDLAGSPLGPTTSAAASLPGGWICEDNLPQRVQFQQASGVPLGEGAMIPTGSVSSVVFLPNGTIDIYSDDGQEQPQVELTIINQRRDQLTLRLRAVTGSISVFNPRNP
jgi:prepilin-type N-terminal cleavage/methylation domain-containing protein